MSRSFHQKFKCLKADVLVFVTLKKEWSIWLEHPQLELKLALAADIEAIKNIDELPLNL